MSICDLADGRSNCQVVDVVIDAQNDTKNPCEDKAAPLGFDITDGESFETIDGAGCQQQSDQRSEQANTEHDPWEGPFFHNSIEGIYKAKDKPRSVLHDEYHQKRQDHGFQDSLSGHNQNYH